MKRFWMITCAFVASGAVGLVYEVVWQRKLAVIFGTTLPAITAVLSAFMLGMALGSYFFGCIADSKKDLLKFYGMLEFGIGVYCFFMPVLLDAVTKIHQILYKTMGDTVVIDFVRFISALIILAVPCSFMGGTLPVLTRAIVSSNSLLGRRIAFLYFINTMGAVIGTLSAGFYLVPHFGLNMTGYIAVCVNLGIGLFFICIPSASGSAVPTEQTSKTASQSSWILWTYLIMGIASMGCEVAWTRSLNLVIGSTVYAFTIMLGGFLLGIALGSLACSFIIDRFNAQQLLGAFALVCGAGIAISIIIISRAPVLLLLLFPYWHDSFIVWHLGLFLIGLLVVFPSTLMMGAIFPALSRTYIVELKSLGKNIGNIYLTNTVGGIIGSALTGFCIIPLIGTRSTLIGFSCTYMIIGIYIIFRMGISRQQKLQMIVLAGILGVFIGVLPNWNPLLLDSGVYVYAPQLKDGFETNRKILFQQEGLHAFVTVSEKNQVKSLRINGKTDGSDGGDLTTQILLAHLPILHSNNPKRAAVIGLGTGVTMGSALKYPGLSVDCIEIDPSVVKASRFFDHVSGSPMKSPNGHLITADARTVFSLNTNQYDVIISEPSNPWITGVSNLFTLEHFQACHHALNDRGIMCQWIHSYYLNPEVLFMILRTFGTVFENSSLWRASPGDYLIIGSVSPLSDDNFAGRSNFFIEPVLADLARIDIGGPDQLKDYRVLNTNEFQRLIHNSGSELNTDNKPFVEFLAPKSLYQNTVGINEIEILKYKL